MDIPVQDDSEEKRFEDLFGPKKLSEEIKNAQKRFTPEQQQQLAMMDALGVNMLWRLYLVSSVAANLNQFDEELAKKFYNMQTMNIDRMMKDLERAQAEFQEKHGEL